MPENTLANVIEVDLVGVAVTQETHNIFYYAGATFADTIGDMIDQFDAVVVQYLVTFMNNTSGFTSIQAQQVKGGGRFGSKPLNIQGSGTGDALPPWNCWDFTYVRGAALERNGYKRISGVGEAAQANGIPTSGILAAINAGIAALTQQLVTTNDGWEPVIRRDVINRVPQIPPKFYTISGVQFSKIGSQNSRKPGHGR